MVILWAVVVQLYECTAATEVESKYSILFHIYITVQGCHAAMILNSVTKFVYNSQLAYYPKLYFSMDL